jgi:hypothetical protein
MHHKYNISKPAFLTGKTTKSIVLYELWDFKIIFWEDGQIIS